MNDLLNRISAAQREAGERVVMDDLRERGLLDVVMPPALKIAFRTGGSNGDWFEWPHKRMPPYALLTAPSIDWKSTDEEFQDQLNAVIEEARKRISESIREAFKDPPECICPTCGIRHGGSNRDGGF